MTTVLADIVRTNDPNGGGSLKIRGATHNDPTDITKKINFVSTAPTTFNVAAGVDNFSETLTFPDKSFTVAGINTPNTFTGTQTAGTLFPEALGLLQTLEPAGTNLIIESISPAILSNEVSTYIGLETPSTADSKIVFSNANSAGVQTTTNFLFTTPVSNITTLFWPSTSTTLANNAVDNAFVADQIFNNGLLTSAITARTTNSNLNLTPNGTGRVEITGTEKVDNLKAKTNVPLLLSGNNLAPISFGTSGFKFANETLKDYTQTTFSVAFTIGAFTTGFLTVNYERIGKEVTIRVPAALGTPAIDGIWTSGVIPAIITPATTQVVQATIGLRNGSQKLPLALRINSTGTLVVGLNNFLTGFGNSGNCGWQIAWSVTYELE